jgi:hypothetical protein
MKSNQGDNEMTVRLSCDDVNPPGYLNAIETWYSSNRNICPVNLFSGERFVAGERNRMDASISNDEMEQHMHHQIIEDLSGYFNLPVDQVVPVYEQELAFLGSVARVRNYLPILVRRRVKVLLSR